MSETKKPAEKVDAADTAAPAPGAKPQADDDTVSLPRGEWEAMKAQMAEMAAKQEAFAKFDRDGGSAPSGEALPKTRQMQPAAAVERSPEAILGNGILSHLMGTGEPATAESLAPMFKVNADQVRQAAKSHAKLVMLGDDVRIA